MANFWQKIWNWLTEPSPSAKKYLTEGAATEGAATEGAATEGAATEGAATEGAAIPKIEVTDEEGNYNISYNDFLKTAEKWRNEQWERENSLRKSTELREDTAYQRAAEDARRAGINLNLIDLKPASSGGGITNATGIDTTLPSDVLNGAISEILQEQQGEIEKSLEKLKQAFEKGENWKDNGTDVLSQLISSVVTLIIGSKLAKK